MRIAFVVNNYLPRMGGVESHVRSLARELAKGGHSVSVFTLGAPTGVSDDDGIEVVRLSEHLRIADVLGFATPGATRRIAALLRARGVEVVSVHTRFFPMSWVGLRAARRVGAMVVHTEHGSGHVVSPSLLVRLGSRAVDHTVGAAILRRADRVLAVSEEVAAFVSRLSGRRAHVFYNAIEPPSAGATRSRPNHLVFVGRLVAGKGWDVFIEAVDILVKQGADVTAEIIGDGVDRSAVDAAVSRSGLGSRIVVRGRVAPSEVRAALAGATLVNPTTLAEGFQTTLLEALAEEARVVTYSVPGARVLREQGHDVTIVDERTPLALAGEIATLLSPRLIESPSSPIPSRADIEQWYWPRRALEFVQICECGSACGHGDR